MAYTTVHSKDHINVQTWTGDGSDRTITTGFQPDLVWIKQRGGTTDHHVYNSIRGGTKMISSNETTAESTKAEGLKTFISTGFTLGNDAGVNGNSNTYVGWSFKGGGTAASNSNGSITSSVSANTNTGISVVKWTGSGSDATIGHGLGVAPKMIWVKSMANTTANMIYHASLGNDREMYLNNGNTDGSSTAWNTTSPTTTVFSVDGGSGNGVNHSGDYVAFCFANAKGHTQVGHYTGNGNADGPFVYCGFRPAIIILKKAGTDNWRIIDDKRLGYNPNNSLLQPSITQADSHQTWHDILSNGFKIRTTDGGDNANGTKYIYLAFASAPIATANNLTPNAR